MKDFSADLPQMLAYAVMPWIAILREAPWIEIIVQIALAWLAALILHRLGTPVLQRLAAPLPFSRKLVLYGNHAGRAVVFLLLVQIILRSTPSSVPQIEILRHLGAIGLIAALTWLAVRSVAAVGDAIIELNPFDAPDNLQARRIQTQTKVLTRSAMVMTILIGSGAALMTLPLLRQIGTSLLASAGVAGLVVGFAAKPVLGNLLAGLQIAIAQPIRLADVLIIENEWGEVEEITGTYVVVRIWDLRRMIIPLQWFIEHPFQNWTRNNSELLGTVSIWADYRLPLDPLRAEAERICKEAPEWDGRLCMIQVVETSEKAMQLRALVSAYDAPRCWDLRCRVREGLVAYIQRDFPECLPRVRAEIEKIQ